MKIKTYKPSEINSCREASKISAAILDELNHLIAVGITTDEIDNFGLLGSGKREVLPSLHHHALAKLIPSIHGNLEHTQRRLYKPLVKSFGLEEQKRNRSNSWLS